MRGSRSGGGGGGGGGLLPAALAAAGLLLLVPATFCQTEADVTVPPAVTTTGAPAAAAATTAAAATASTGAVTWEQPQRADAARAARVVQRALHYLLQRREPDWGWGNDTANVVLAIQLANSSLKESEQQSLEMQLSTKQMEVEILLMMSKHHESPPPLARLAAYALALGSLCRDPRSFHQRDLVSALLHREPPHDLDFAYATLAACSSAAHVRRRHIRRLLDIANAAADHNLETISMVILALRCIVQDHRHRDLLHFVRRPMAGLARQQQPDGGFGAVATTALAIQALENVEGGPGAHQHWNRSAARGWLLARQAEDGGWGGVAVTAGAAAALAPSHLAAVRPPHCRDKVVDSRHDAIDSNGGDGSLKLSYPAGLTSNESDARNVSFTYTLWIGTNVTENYTLYMVAPRNISFYHVMQMAAEQDPKFKFTASEWPNGHYVHTLAEHREEPMGYHYWLLYRMTEIPDPASPPGNQLVAPVGVDDLLVEEGEHYLFWYKKL